MRAVLLVVLIFGLGCDEDAEESSPRGPTVAPATPPDEPPVAPVDPAFHFEPLVVPACEGEVRRSCAVEGGGVRLSFDAEGRPAQEAWARRGLTLGYEYDELGRLARQGLDVDGEAPSEWVRLWSGEGDARRVDERARDDAGAEPPWPLRACLGPELARRDCTHLAVFSRGSGFGVSRVRYDAEGRRVERETDTFGNHRPTERVAYTYEAGRLVLEEKETSRYVRRHVYRYDAEGRCVREELGTVGHPPLVSLHHYDDAGRRTRTVDEEGNTLVDRRYDAEGRLVREALDIGTGSGLGPDGEVSEVVTYVYDDDGHLERRTRSWDDGLHREVDRLRPDGALMRREFFEGRGRARWTEEHHFDEQGRDVGTTRTARGVSAYERVTIYDAFGGRLAVETRRERSPTCTVHARTCALGYLSRDAPTEEPGPTCARACALLLDYE